MSNVLKVSHQEAVRSLHAKNWSQRRIARELGIHRKTVWRYTQKLAAKCTISTPGSETASAAKCTISTSGVAGRRSDCDPFAGVILSKLGLGLCAQRIFQDLGAETGFEGSYQSVKRYVQKLKASEPRRVWRVESQPGEEMQVDFGLGAPIEIGPGKTRRSWVFRVVLSYSRKAYSEAVLRQDTETFLRCLENAVRSFGGTPLLVNLDNLKAAVLQADWFDPEVNPKLAQFCRHYAMNVLPCRPYTPQHKGKIERGICYVRSNALKGRRFASLGAQNLFLAEWEKKVADTRIHGTTRQQIRRLLRRGACAFTAAARRALPVLPGSAPQRASRQLCGSGQGLLRSAAGIHRAHGLGALGWTHGAHPERAAGADRHPHTPGAWPVQPLPRDSGRERASGPIVPLLDRSRVLVRRSVRELGSPNLRATRPPGVASHHRALPVERQAQRGGD